MMNWNAVVSACALLSVVAPVTVARADGIRWATGARDDGGAPAGALLTANPGWWGESGPSDVTYVYAEEPTAPADRIGGKTGVSGRRLLDGDRPTGSERSVGTTGSKPIDVTFDFKRICSFFEIDLLSAQTTNSFASVFLSSDGEDFRVAAMTGSTGSVTRIRLEKAVDARYLRIVYKNASGAETVLDEVLAWGKSPDAPEPPRIAAGDALRMSGRRDGAVSLYAVPDPADQLDAEPRLPQAGDRPVERVSLLMAKGEVETRYFALVNETAEPTAVALGVTVSGGGDFSAEWRIAGLVRSDPPSRKLSEKELFDMLLTEQKASAAVPPGGRLSFRPFFAADAMPDRRFLLKRVANADQVLGFPSAVPLAPGEGALLMLRFRTRDAAPCVKRPFALTIGGRKIPGEVTVADVALSARKPWVYAWCPFTGQYPFESDARAVADAEAMLELGVTHYAVMPGKGTRGRYIMEREPQSTFATLVTTRPVFHQVYNGRSELTDADRAAIAEDLDRSIAEARAAGLPLDRFSVELPDEPHEGSALGIGRMAKIVKDLHPELNVFSDPSFWTRRGCFADAETVVGCLGWFYNDCVDISVPYRSNMEDPVKREKLFCRPRKVNAQYAHPARRAGRSIAWSSFRYGLDGFAFWAYYTPRGDPWDIRTWTLYDFDQAEMVFPLEKGVAITYLYENMREAAEDYRLLTAVREAGKTDALEAVLAEFAAAFRPDMAETPRPYDCDFPALRDRLLKLFVNP